MFDLHAVPLPHGNDTEREGLPSPTSPVWGYIAATTFVRKNMMAFQRRRKFERRTLLHLVCLRQHAMSTYNVHPVPPRILDPMA
jgi:hypothetical protein